MSVPAAFAVERVVAAAAALDAADEVGLLEAIPADGGKTATTLADDLALDAELVARTLDALAAVDVAAVDEDGRYRITSEVQTVLDTSRAQYGSLPGVLRDGQRPRRADAAAEAPRLYQHLAPVLGRAFRDAADEFAAHLAPVGPRVLDVGAGAAPWSLAIHRRRPESRVVALDLPGMIATTRQAVRKAGAADSYRCVGGDVLGDLDVIRGEQFDLVLIGNLCHLFAPERAASLLARVARYVAPTGRLAVVDTLSTANPPAALYALGLALRTETGGVHGRNDYERWLRAADLPTISVYWSSQLPGLGLLMAARQATSKRKPL